MKCFEPQKYMSAVRTLLLTTLVCGVACGSPEVAPSPVPVDADLSDARFWVAHPDAAVNPWDTKTGKAMTWRQLQEKGDVVLVGADSSSGRPKDGTTNPYDGDADIGRALPVLCLNKDNSEQPEDVVTSMFAGWASGKVQLTAPIAATLLSSRQVADMLCADTFGAGFRMAEVHDGVHNGTPTDWRFYALGKLAVISPQARILSAQARRDLQRFDQDRGTLLFAGSAPSLQIGTVVVSEPTAVAPYGIPPLRVIARREAGGMTQVDTVPSSLDEIIEQGDLDVSRALSSDDLEEVDSNGSMALQTWQPLTKLCKSSGLGIKCEFEVPEGDSPVHLKGSFEFKARQEFALRFRKIFRIKEFKVAVGLEESARLALELVHNADLFNFEVPIKQFRIKRWVFFIGPVPVTVEMYVKFKLGGNGKVSLAYEYSVNQSASILYGYRYTHDRGWEKINERNFDLNVKTPSTTATVNGEVKGYIAAVPGVGLYAPARLVGAESDIGAVRAYAKLKAQYPGTPRWRYSAGLEFCSGLNLTLKLRLLVLKRDFEFKIKEGDCADLELWKKEFGGDAPMGTWTPWLNRDAPSGDGDYEDLSNFLMLGQACPKPLDIECQTVSGVDWKAAGQAYSCTTTDGGICVNASQPGGRSCLDYRVRFLCP